MESFIKYYGKRLDALEAVAKKVSISVPLYFHENEDGEKVYDAEAMVDYLADKIVVLESQ